MVFIGDAWNNRPFGYGMIYFINGGKFECKVFCSMFGNQIAEKYEANEQNTKII